MSPKQNAYSRAQMRARFRKPKARRSGSMVWGVVIVVILVLGVGAIVVAREGREASANVPPLAALGDEPGDHWHAYLGVNVCGTWLPNAPEFHFDADSSQVNVGIHSHGDGNIHIHPYRTAEAGNNATVGRFVDYGGWELSEDSMQLWDESEHANGDTCEAGDFEGEEAEIQWTVDGERQSGNLADYKPEDGEIIALYFLPDGAELSEPPGADQAIASPIDEQGNPAAPGGSTEVPSVPPSEPAPSAPPGS